MKFRTLWAPEGRAAWSVVSLKTFSIELCQANLGKVIERGDNFPFSRTFPSEDFGTAQQGQFGHGGFNGEALRDHKYSLRWEFHWQATVFFLTSLELIIKLFIINCNFGYRVGTKRWQLTAVI